VKYTFFVIAVVVLGGLRIGLAIRRRRQTQAPDGTGHPEAAAVQPAPARVRRPPRPGRGGLGPFQGDVALVAAREIRERLRGRIFRIGTLVILAVVAGAIVIPKLTGNSGSSAPQRVGVVGPLTPGLRAAVATAGRSAGTGIHLVREPSLRAGDAGVRDGNLDLAIVNDRALLVDRAISPSDTSTTASLVPVLAQTLGIYKAFVAAGLTPGQTAEITGAKSLPVRSLQPGKANAKSAVRGTSVIGLILIFVMLTQYNTWMLIGVMEEKSSRVVEVLLAAVRPVQLLGGKVLGIGLVAFGQAALILAFALILGASVGSDLLKGSAPVVLVSTLFWLVLGYAFYSWVYAAAGSMAERQDQVQSLAFPLSLPIIVGYIVSLTAVTSGTASTFIKVLAYVPLTAPFAMPVLVGFRDVAWWQFLASAVLSLAATVLVARAAAGIYRRAILRTGRRVRVLDVLSRAPR
jgi:ABC-2 type transport system permease protein